MAKDTVRAKKRSKQKEQNLEEVAMEEKVVQKEKGTISTKRKKKKKELVSEENEQNDISEVKEKIENGEKKKKKKKKSSDISATENVEANVKTEITEPEEQHAGTETKKKKKKKKKLQQQEDIKPEELVALVCEGGKRKRNGELLPAGHDGDIPGLDFGEEASVAALKKIKKKKKKKQSDESNRDIEENGAEDMHEQSTDTTGSISAEGEMEKKKRKRKAADAEEACVQFEQPTQEKQENKKKKRKEVNLEGDPSTTSNIKQTEHKKEKRKKADSSRVKDMTHTAAGADLGISEERNAGGKAKTGKKKKAISVNTETPELTHKHTEEEKKKQKRKKAKKEHKEKAAAQQPLTGEKDEGEATGAEAVNGKKRKKKQTDSSEACTVTETPILKKKKKLSEESAPAKAVKQEENQRTVSGEEHQEVTEVVFLSEKPGNQDEILIDQERRLALQRDIDKESQPKTAFGQWSTATFDNADQQQKFLRLMGGFKKGSQSLVSSAGQPNMAMGKEEQQNLQHKLLGQFQQAQNRRMDFSNKGAGLGFVAPSNKKFAIDINASRSVKFDD